MTYFISIFPSLLVVLYNTKLATSQNTGIQILIIIMHLLPLASTVATLVPSTGATPVPPTGALLMTRGKIIIVFVDDLKSIVALKLVLRKNHAILYDIFQSSIVSISNELYAADIITHGVQMSPSYDAIIGQFEAGMKFKRTQRDLEEHCNKFITALTNVGGPVKDAALMIQQEWIDIVNRELGIEFDIN